MQMSRGLITRFNNISKIKTDGGISYALRSSKVQLRWKSRAASVPSSDTPKLKRKRVSKDKRREMVVSFVDRYREMNAGKFPTASLAKTEVGGSYYVVKKILQELEYNSRSYPLDKQNRSTSSKDAIVDNEAVGEVQERHMDKVSESTKVENLEINNVSDKQLQAEVVSEKTSADTENNTSEEVLTSQPVEKVDGTAINDLPGTDDMKQSNTESQEPMEVVKLVSDMEGNQPDDVDSPKSRVWEGLKSLADGIVKLWKRM